MEYGRGFLDGTNHVPAGHFVSDFGHGHELPFFLPVQLGHINTPADSIPGQFIDFLQRPLDPIENTFDQARCQFYGHGHPGGFHRFPRSQAGRFFVYLNGGFIIP